MPTRRERLVLDAGPTLTDFLLARIAEDEAELGVLQTRDESAGPNGVGWADVGAISDVLMVSHRRVLAECEAKRQIVSLHEPWRPYGTLASSPDVCSTCAENYEVDYDGAPMVDWPCPTLRALAAVYTDHPEYREDWRPR